MAKLSLRKAAYTVEALIDAGVPAARALTLRVAVGQKPERALVSVRGRTRTRDTITDYVWGPDAMVLLEGKA